MGYLSIWYVFVMDKNMESAYLPLHIFSWQEEDKDYYTCIEYPKEHTEDDSAKYLTEETDVYKELYYEEMLLCFGNPIFVDYIIITDSELQDYLNNVLRNYMYRKYYFPFLAKWFMPYQVKKVTWKRDCYSYVIAVYDANIENPKKSLVFRDTAFFHRRD